jgi:phage antirepressor YoqD-like protein
VQIYEKNIILHNLKMEVRQHNMDPDSIRIKTQKIEGKRDSLYNTVITGATYQLYLQKKGNLISAN